MVLSCPSVYNPVCSFSSFLMARAATEQMRQFLRHQLPFRIWDLLMVLALISTEWVTAQSMYGSRENPEWKHPELFWLKSHFLFERARCFSRSRAFCFCLVQVSTTQFCCFPPVLMAGASDGTDVPVSPLPASFEYGFS